MVTQKMFEVYMKCPIALTITGFPFNEFEILNKYEIYNEKSLELYLYFKSRNSTNFQRSDS